MLLQAVFTTLLRQLTFNCSGSVSQLHVVGTFLHLVKVSNDSIYESGS